MQLAGCHERQLWFATSCDNIAAAGDHIRNERLHAHHNNKQTLLL
jgi:hypothetical protein